jgi:signal transduction histidine kinase
MVSIEDSIARHHAQILELWSARAERASSAVGLSRPVFANMMGEYLSALGAPYREEEEDAEADTARSELLEQHLSVRLRQGFELAEMVRELSLLGQCVARSWANCPVDERPDPVQLHSFYARLQRDAATATTVFTRHMLEDEQKEKRFRRALRELAYEGLKPGAAPFHQRVDDVLRIVATAMNVQSAALLLASESEGRRQLGLVGATGVGAEHMRDIPWVADYEDLRVQHGPHVESPRRHEVADILHQSGVHSLISAPLDPHCEQAGMLVVGTVAERHFGARDRRLLEALAEQITLHLDSARLFADLRTTIDELHRERGLRELFVAVLAHDLRGPLASARTAAHLLVHSEDLPCNEEQELENSIDRNIQRMDTMIRNLLDVSRMRSDQRMPLQLGECCLATLAAEVVEELTRAFGREFQTELDTTACGIWSAEDLRRALWNLGANAAKYGAPEKPVTVAAKRTSDGARLCVHNCGPSIAVEDQGRLFEPFSRTADADASLTSGWGLGLFLVRECAQAHGGQISVTSTEAEGTTFVLDLPLDSTPFQS